MESGRTPPCPAAVSNIANALGHADSGQHRVQPGNLAGNKKLFCLAGVSLFGLAGGVVVALKGRLRDGQAQQPPFVCLKQGDAMRTRVYGAQVHLLKDGDSNTVPASATMKKINAAFDTDNGVNAIFGNSCDEVLGERIRFTRLDTDVVDATHWQTYSTEPGQIDFTEPYAVTFGEGNAEGLDYENNFLNQADPEKQHMHLFVAKNTYIDGSIGRQWIGGFGLPSNNYQFYSLDYLNNPVVGASSGDEGFIPSVFAHEFGHNFGLAHSGDPQNIMTSASGGVAFTPEQCKQVAQTLQSSLSSLVDLCEEQSRNATSNSATSQPTVAPTTEIVEPDVPHDRLR